MAEFTAVIWLYGGRAVSAAAAEPIRMRGLYSAVYCRTAISILPSMDLFPARLLCARLIGAELVVRFPSVVVELENIVGSCVKVVKLLKGMQPCRDTESHPRDEAAPGKQVRAMDGDFEIRLGF